MNYATYQFKKFRTEVGDVEPLEPKACQILRTQAKEDLDVVKGQYIMVWWMKRRIDDGTLKKSGDGIATNQNKFFFDIIKWGSALLL